MQSALKHAYKSSNNNIVKTYQNQVPHKDDVPTPDEFIRYAVEKINSKQ